MMNLVTSQQRQQFKDDGFFLARGLFDEPTRQEMRAWLSDLAARRADFPASMFVLEPGAAPDAEPLAAIRKIQGVHQQPDALQFWGAQGKPAQMAGELIGHSALRFGSSAFTKPAGHGSETPWHQDQMLWSIWTPTAVSCWVALDPCTLENGCLQFVRGSHRDGMIEHVSTPEQRHPHIPKDQVDASRVVMLEMEPGDAVFFGGQMWHFSEPNRSSQPRLGTVAVFNSELEYQQTRDIAGWVNGRRALDFNIGEQPKTAVVLGKTAASNGHNAPRETVGATAQLEKP